MVRLYVPDLISEEKNVSLDAQQAHYLRNVLRKEVGDLLHLFNAASGEWQGELVTLTKTQAEVRALAQFREPQEETPVGLVFAPLKHEAQLFLVEKATELGVSILQPVQMERGNISKINGEKLQRNALEASQQCERLSIPEVREIMSLRQLMDNWPDNQVLVVCQERGETKSVVEVLSEISLSKIVYFLVGPEGGISPKEIEHLAKQPFVRFCHLGPRILRAETAVAAALAAHVFIRQ